MGSPRGVMPSRWDARVARSMAGCEVDMHSGRPVADHFSPGARDQHVRVLDSIPKFSITRGRSLPAVPTGGVLWHVTTG